MRNRQAFLDMIAHSEGTTRIKGNDNGYNVLVGGGLFSSYDDHPRQKIWLQRLAIWSTAAGRYQILERTFDAYAKQLGLIAFGPAEQDQIALELIKERRALDDIDAGRFADAVEKVRNIWASLPGAGYGQHENLLADLEKAYVDAGGTLA